MENYYWYTVCPTCHGQGRLFITEDLSKKILYLHCEECETGYSDPLNIMPEFGFLTLTQEIDYKLANFEIIKNYGWEKFAVNKVNEMQAPNM